MRQIHSSRGAILVYVLLVISLITAIAVTVSIIIINELKLTTGAADATMAYYAAESGIERGLYAVKTERPKTNALTDVVAAIQAYTSSFSSNEAEYDNNGTASQTSKIENQTIQENGYLQADYYNVDSPLQSSGVESITVQNGTMGNNPDSGSYAEVSWIAWNNQGTLGTSTSARRVIGPSGLEPDPMQPNGWTVNLDVFNVPPNPISPVGYRIRVKALLGDLSNLTVTPYDGGGTEVTNLPSQIVVKSVGQRGSFKQALTAIVPWKVPLFGLYDYVLFSEGGIAKTTILSEPIYSSGAIQVESNLPTPTDCTGCQAFPVTNTCTEWLAVCCAEQASCTVNASGGSCDIDSTSTHWVLPIPDYVPSADDYYLSLRMKYANSNGQLRIIQGDTCKTVGYQSTTDWVSCTIPAADFGTSPNTTLKFEQIDASNIDLDWYQLSTYKIFEDCQNVNSCSVPSPAPGKCVCEPGETSPLDDMACGGRDQCIVPACENGCTTRDLDDQEDPDYGCTGNNRCCSGSCVPLDPPLYCNSDAECDDLGACTTDICTNPATCTSSCTNTLIVACGASEGCCPAGCNNIIGDPNYDPDCVGPPDEEYLRYIARDENEVDLAALYYPGRSQRAISAWNSQNSGSNYLRRVWAADANRVWAVGASGTIMYTTDGGATPWGTQPSGTTNELRGIYGLNGSSIWAVGFNNTFLYYDGNSWSSLSGPPVGTQAIYGVWAADVNNVWVVGGTDGSSGWVYHCSNNCGTNPTWDVVQYSTDDRLHDIFGISTVNIWAVGDGEIIVKYDGSAWTVQQDLNSARILTGIAGTTDGTHLWTVGSAGALYYCNNCGGSWVSQATPLPTSANYDIAAFYDSGNVKAVISGQTNTFFYNGSSWYTQQIGTSALAYYGVSAVDINNIWVVGQSQTILYANAPGQFMTVGTGFNQYWYSKQYSYLDPPSGTYYGNLNVIRNTGGTGPSLRVTVTLSVGYCDDTGNNGTICDQSNDFTTLSTSAPQTISGANPTFYPNILIATGDILCNNCRFWTQLLVTSGTAATFDMSVSGRDAGYSETLYRNSYVDLP